MVRYDVASGANDIDKIGHPMKIFANRFNVAVTSIVASLCLTSQGTDALACTTFSYTVGAQNYVAKSYDWHQEDALVYVNKRNVAKASIKVFPHDIPVTWISKYGSITFNQYGRELPNGGLNEAGLVVEVMEFQSAEYEQADARPSVNESQWVQYMLDNAASIQEIRSLAPNLRVSKILVPLHYMACDSSGSCATMEYINGQLVVTSQTDDRTKVLTNNSYAESLAYLSQFARFGGDRPTPTGPGSLNRFVRAAYFLDQGSSKNQADQFSRGFEGLNSVKTSITQWNIVYDIQGKRVAFNSRSAAPIKWINMNAFAFECSKPAMALPMISQEAGDATTRFTPYQFTQNYDLIQRSMSGQVPKELMEAAAHLPEQTSCVQP